MRTLISPALTIHVLLASALLAQSAEQAAATASGLMAAGRFADAAAAYEIAVKALPANPGLRLNLGMAYHMAGNDRLAVAPLEAALKANPNLPPALLFLGASYFRLGEPAKAVPHLRKYLATDPAHEPARAMLAQAALETAQFDEAATQFHAMPPTAQSLFSLGKAYEGLASQAFDKLDRAARESGYWFALLAESRSKVSQSRAAFLLYRKAAAKLPSMRGLHAAIAEIYRRTGHADWAATEDALEAKLPKPNCAAARTLECEFAAGRFLPLATTAKPRLTAESFYWQAKAYDALARDTFTKLAALPESVEVHQLLAEMHRDQGRHTEAVAQWQAALKLKKGDPALRRELAASLFATKDYENAQAMLTGLLAAEPVSADLNFLQGDLLLAQQQAEPAIPFLEKAAAAEPRMLAARAALGRALLQAGRAADAIPHLKAALPADTDGALYFQLARAHQAAGQEAESKAAMAKYQQIRARSGAAERELDEEGQIGPPR